MDKKRIAQVLEYFSNRNKLLASPPLFPAHKGKAYNVTEWISSNTYTLSGSEEVRSSLLQMLQNLFRIEKLKPLLKITALESASKSLTSIALIDKMQDYRPFSNSYGHYNKQDIIVSYCLEGSHDYCKRVLTHEIAHLVVDKVYNNRFAPYPKDNEVSLNKYKQAVLDTFVNIAHFLNVAQAHPEAAIYCPGLNNHYTLGKHLYSTCIALSQTTYHPCIVISTFMPQETEENYDMEIIANFIETYSLGYGPEEMEVYHPLERYWEEEVIPELQNYIQHHPSAEFVLG